MPVFDERPKINTRKKFYKIVIQTPVNQLAPIPTLEPMTNRLPLPAWDPR